MKRTSETIQSEITETINTFAKANDNDKLNDGEKATLRAEHEQAMTDLDAELEIAIKRERAAASKAEYEIQLSPSVSDAISNGLVIRGVRFTNHVSVFRGKVKESARTTVNIEGEDVTLILAGDGLVGAIHMLQKRLNGSKSTDMELAVCDIIVDRNAKAYTNKHNETLLLANVTKITSIVTPTIEGDVDVFKALLGM